MTLLYSLDNPRRPPRSGDGAALRWLLEEAAAIAFGVAPADVRARTRRGAHVTFARQTAMYLAHVAFGLNYSDVGRLFGRDRTTVAYACRLVEDRRDDPATDRRLDLLEQVCGEAVSVPATLPPVQAARP
ncbi:MAG TPA: helix-turn-helix domain-containing protein [Pseudolabrys sp.]|nr:helix-turn-helix domain-containing protein [Pseudolabrys sp.]